MTRRRTRWLALWSVLGLIAGAVVSQLVPRVYQASTMLLIIPQQVPQSMVTPIVTEDVSSRLDRLTKQILSRTRLGRVIQEFDLYSRERERLIMEDVVQLLRQDISVSIPKVQSGAEPVRSVSVSYRGTNPRTVMRVTERLGSLFVEEHIKEVRTSLDRTADFLSGRIEKAGTELHEREQRLSEMKRRGATTSAATIEYEVLADRYRTLLKQRAAFADTEAMERLQIGERFQILDGARFPERPIGPRAGPYLVLGALGGLGAGLVLPLIASAWRRRRTQAVPASGPGAGSPEP